jgi:hypothetical protein
MESFVIHGFVGGKIVGLWGNSDGLGPDAAGGRFLDPGERGQSHQDAGMGLTTIYRPLRIDSDLARRYHFTRDSTILRLGRETLYEVSVR